MSSNFIQPDLKPTSQIIHRNIHIHGTCSIYLPQGDKNNLLNVRVGILRIKDIVRVSEIPL